MAVAHLVVAVHRAVFKGIFMRVFDFDNTIYDGESGMDIFLYYLKRDPKGVAKFVPKFMEGFMRYKRHLITIDEVKTEYASYVKEYFKKIANIYEDFEKFWDINEKNIKSFYPKIQKEDDVILSACPYCLLSIMTNRLGVKNVISTDLNPETGEIGEICYHENKVKMFRDVYGDVEIDEFYTDSMSDKPMMDISKTVFLVDGNKLIKIKKDGVYLSEKFE